MPPLSDQGALERIAKTVASINPQLLEMARRHYLYRRQYREDPQRAYDQTIAHMKQVSKGVGVRR